MAFFTTYCKDRILSHYFVANYTWTQNPASPDPPSGSGGSGTRNTYATLLKGNPGVAGTMTEVPNVDRVSIPWGTTATNGQLSTISDLTFDTTNVVSSHTVTGIGIVEDSESGHSGTRNLLAYGALTGGSITVDSTASVKIGTGSLKTGFSENSDAVPSDSDRAISDQVAQDAIDATFKYSSPQITNPDVNELFLALFVQDNHPLVANTEFSGGNYSRQAITFSSPAAGSTADRRKVSNTNAITFQNIQTAAGNNPATHWAVYKTVGGTDYLLAVNDHAPVTVQNGDDITFGVGDIIIEIE